MPMLSEDKSAAYQGIWVVAETAGDKLHPVSLELLGEARRLAAKGRQEVVAVIMGEGVARHFAALERHGAETIIAVEAPGLARFNDEDQAALLLRLISRRRPAIVVAGATANGRALMPRVAALVDCGLTADCTSLELEDVSGALLQTRPAFGGSLMATIRSDRFMPQMATVRPGVMRLWEAPATRPANVVRERWEERDQTGLKELLELIPDTDVASGIEGAELIIAGGRGMKGPEGFELLRLLAQATGGVVGATRAAVDAGWISYGAQVGQTGRVVRPRVYVGCGISGQIQHLVGMQSSDKIIAVNTDANAPFMELADVAVVGDVFKVVPELIKKLGARRAKNKTIEAHP